MKLQKIGVSKGQPLVLSGQSFRSLTQGPVGHWTWFGAHDNHSGQKSVLQEPSAQANYAQNVVTAGAGCDVPLVRLHMWIDILQEPSDAHFTGVAAGHVATDEHYV